MYKFSYYFLDNLTKNQKSSIVSYVKIFVKKHQTLSIEDIWAEFVSDIEYDFAINNPRFPWMKDCLYEVGFEKDVKNIIKSTLQQILYKERQKPYIAKQKELAKEARKRASDWRQSHEKPTKKQILYYNALCEKKRKPKDALSDKSKFDLKLMIAKLLENSDAENKY